MVLRRNASACLFTVSSLHSLLSIPSVVETISTLANPQQSGGTHPLVAKLVLLLPGVQADCVELRPCRRRRTRADCLDNKICSIISNVTVVFIEKYSSCSASPCSSIIGSTTLTNGTKPQPGPGLTWRRFQEMAPSAAAL